MRLTPESLFLLQSFVIIVMPFLLWQMRIIRKFVPLVMMQILLGIILGPSIMGRYLPTIFHTFYPPGSLVILNGVAWLGLSLFGFLAGLHFDIRSVTKRGSAFIATGLSSLLLPMLLGTIVALAFFRAPYTQAGVAEWVHILGIATAIAVTALPVLSAILIELKLIDTALGRRVLGYAVMNDLLLWVVIALLTGYSSVSGYGLFHASKVNVFLITAGFTALFLACMILLVKPLLQRLVDRKVLTLEPSSAQVACIVAGVLLAGFCSEFIGIHYLFGAFVLGAIMPRTIGQSFHDALEKITMLILLPFFFILTGLKTSFSLDDGHILVLFACASAAAILGKVIGTALPERIFQKTSSYQALKAGTLMQTKGLMEVVVLNILLTAHIINTLVFSALILMAIFTTLITKPVLLILSTLARRAA